MSPRTRQRSGAAGSSWPCANRRRRAAWQSARRRTRNTPCPPPASPDTGPFARRGAHRPWLYLLAASRLIDRTGCTDADWPSDHVEPLLLRNLRTAIVGPGKLELSRARHAHVERQIRVGGNAGMQLGLENFRPGKRCSERIDDEARNRLAVGTP